MDSQSFWIVAASIIIFLICRELFCWYWKQNQIISLLTDIRSELKKQNKIDSSSVKEES